MKRIVFLVLFGVHVPLLYGEGKNAFLRLQLEILKTNDDVSILAWGISPWGRYPSDNVLAVGVEDFMDAGHITPTVNPSQSNQFTYDQPWPRGRSYVIPHR